MSANGRVVHESVHAVGRSATEARAIVQATFAADREYRFVELNHLSYQLVRAAKSLLLRKVETCTVTVTEGSTGAMLTLTGKLLPDRIDRLKQGLERRSAPVDPLHAAPDAAVEPPRVVPAEPVALDEETAFRPIQRPVATISDTLSARYALRFDNGDVRQLERVVVIGRDPSAAVAGPDTERVVVEDTLVSKAHVTLGVDASGAWVEDLYSTNGTFIHVHGVDPVPVAGGERRRIEPGSVVRFGTRFVTLTRAD